MKEAPFGNLLPYFFAFILDENGRKILHFTGTISYFGTFYIARGTSGFIYYGEEMIAMIQTNSLRRAVFLSAALVMMFAVCLTAIAGDYPVAVVSNPNAADRLNLRTSPAKDAKSIGMYYNGVIVTVMNQTNATWWEVEVFGRKGYMEAAYLTPCGSQSGYDQAVLDRVGSAKPLAQVGGQRPQDGLHLRNKPSDQGKSYGKFYNGTAVEILGTLEDGAWYHVYLPDARLNGFMLAKYVQANAAIKPPAGGGATLSGTYAVVNNPVASDRLNLRAEASDKSDSLGKYRNGTTVEVLSDGSTWCEVKVDGKTGYMLAKHLVKDSSLKTLVTLDRGRTLKGYQTLHSAPSDTAPVLAVPNLEISNSLVILGKAGTWYYVEINGVRGYYPVNYVDPCVLGLGDDLHYAVVTGPNTQDRLNLRASASETSSSLGLYFVGTQVEVLERNTTGGPYRDQWWFKVRVDGKIGYMHALYLLDVWDFNAQIG